MFFPRAHLLKLVGWEGNRAGWAGSGLPGGKARGESGKREKKKTAAPPPAPKSPNPSLPAGPLRLLRGGRLHTPRASSKGGFGCP